MDNLFQNLTEDDMCNLIRFFRIPTKLYEQISRYANSKKLTIKLAMAQLLALAYNDLPTHKQQYLLFYKNNYIDITKDWSKKLPKIVNDGSVKQFVLKFTPELKTEIFKIFVQTHYKTATPEMNVEICARLALAIALYF